MKKATALLFGLITFVCVAATAQDTKPILLWPSGAPGSEGKTTPEHSSKSSSGLISISNVNFPSITPYLPKGKANGLAVIIAPGGGHTSLKMDYEGSYFADYLSEHGVTCFVLKYRLAKEPGSTYTVDGDAVKDMQRAIRLVRLRAKEWGIDTARIGVAGFSAGGELAALSSIRFDYGNKTATDPIEQLSSRPNLQILIYPGQPDRSTPQPNSPPLFIAVGDKDDPARIKGITQLYLRYNAANIPAELHIYSKAVHGFGIRKPGVQGPVNTWADRCYDWLELMGFVK
jgi:acetyl esterase/lipase